MMRQQQQNTTTKTTLSTSSTTTTTPGVPYVGVDGVPPPGAVSNDKERERRKTTGQHTGKKEKSRGWIVSFHPEENNFGRSRCEFRFLGHCRKNTLRHGYYKKITVSRHKSLCHGGSGVEGILVLYTNRRSLNLGRSVVVSSVHVPVQPAQ